MDERVRMSPSRARVEALMQGGDWWRTDRLAQTLGMRNIGTVTSKIRDLAAYFGWSYERRKTDEAGIFEYRLVPRNPGQLPLL